MSGYSTFAAVIKSFLLLVLLLVVLGLQRACQLLRPAPLLPSVSNASGPPAR